MILIYFNVGPIGPGVWQGRAEGELRVQNKVFQIISQWVSQL